jgi:hypothetical protein
MRWIGVFVSALVLATSVLGEEAGADVNQGVQQGVSYGSSDYGSCVVRVG